MKKEPTYPILHTEHLTIGYGTKKKIVTIANDLNLSLTTGKMVCLLGQNGIGKSTLLRTLCNTQAPIAGNIYLGGHEIQRLSTKDLSKKVGLVLTERIPENNLTAYELIALGRQPYTNWIGSLTKEDHVHISKAIDYTKTGSFVNKKHTELSDGQIQKIMIARVLAQNTEIIALDEPTAHLDIENKVALFTTLKKLCVQLDKTVLMTTHEIQWAMQMADELWLMTKSGVRSGTTNTLVDNGHIQKLFNSNLITFDTSSQQFIVNPR